MTDQEQRAEQPPESGSGRAFTLDTLGWQAFQDLCGVVLATVLGQTVQSFRPTRDAGRDFAYEGEWRTIGGEVLSGHFVVQSKFKAHGNFFRSDLTPELPKVRRLVAAGRCDTYILMTNAGFTAATAGDMHDDLVASGVRHVQLIGGDTIDRYIRENPRLRANVPRLYGLGDLTQILDERRYRQAHAILSSMREDIKKFVLTGPYARAVTALVDHGFVLLLGAPAAGKSMIASALAAASIDMWQSRPIKVESASAFSNTWNPDEPAQFFWVDDAFGATQFQRQRADEWNQVLGHMRAATLQGAKFVMTSRDYIWAEAAPALKLSAFPELSSQQVVVDVHDLSVDDKRRILYNHLRFGTQPRAFRTEVKPHLEAAASVDNFLPEVARRFGDPRFTGRVVSPMRSSVPGFFEHPIDHLAEVVNGLGADEFASLALLFMAQGSRPSPIELTALEAGSLERLGSSLGGVGHALEALRGSLVTLGIDGTTQEMTWSFKHPTIADAVRQRISGRPELLEIYLVGAPIQLLMREITCGQVEIAGALVVPPRHFDLVSSRLANAVAAGQLAHDVGRFLTSRCGPEFIETHGRSVGVIQIDPGRPGADSIAARLAEVGLLADEVRHTIVGYHQRAAIQDLNLEILDNPNLRGLMAAADEMAFIAALRDEALEVRVIFDSERDDYDGSEPPEDVVGRLREILDTLCETFPGDDDVLGAVAAVREDLPWLEETLSEDWQPEPDLDDDWREYGRVAERSDVGMFSDVDQP